MSDTPTAAAVVVAAAPPRGSMREWIPHVIALVGMIFAGGQLHGRLGENERRVVQLEARADRMDGDTRDLGRKIERLDGKLDVLIERTPARP